MKIYSIGREAGCDIVINDSTDVISRRHATLNVSSTGKMTIVDQSHNGTYVNGMRIQPNVPYPVSRKDTVSLAHVAKLDWNMVPKAGIPMQYVGMAGGAVAFVVAVVLCASLFSGGKDTQPATAPVADSTQVKQEKTDTVKQQKEEKEKEETKKEEQNERKDTAQQKKAKTSDGNKTNGKKVGKTNTGGNKTTTGTGKTGTTKSEETQWVR